MANAAWPTLGGTSRPVRLLVAAELSGGTGRKEVRAAGGAAIDDLLASFEPRVRPIQSLPEEIAFRRLDDFTPQALRRSASVTSDRPGDQGGLDEILHAAPFQALESCWRGLALLLREAARGSSPSGTTGAPEVDLLDVNLRELRRSPDDLFLAAARSSRGRYDAILVELEVKNDPADGDFLRSITALAESHRTPLILAASPSLVGLQHGAHLPGLADPAGRLDPAWNGGWRAFRVSDGARFLALTVNRFLLRQPYTQDAGGHEESVSPSRPADYLWGGGHWLAGADLLRSGRAHGHPLALSGIVPERYHDLPCWSWTAPGGVRQSSCLEATFDQESVQRFVRAGLTPVFEPAGAGCAVLPLIVNAFRPDPRRIPVEGTLAHTLVLAHFVSALAAAARVVALEADDEAANALLRTELQSAMAVPLRRGSAAALDTSVRRLPDERVACATLRGDLTGSGRDEEIDLSIPLSPGAV
jgi:hypothetical protein